jgi:5'-nucleotidase
MQGKSAGYENTFWLHTVRRVKQSGYSPFLLIPIFLLISTGFAEERREVLSILYTGETGGKLLPWRVEGGRPPSTSPEFEGRERGGAARRKGLIDTIRRRIGDDHLLLLDTGDAVGTDYLARADSGKTVIDIMRRTGYDGMVLGNHEFDYGREMIEMWPVGDRFHLLGANILREDGTPLVTPFYVTEKAGGIRIAVIGLTDKQIETKVLKTSFEGLHVEEPLVVAKRFVSDLRGRVDLIIALTHLPTGENLQLVRHVEGIDLVIGLPEKELSGSADRNDYTLIGRVDRTTPKRTLLVNTTPRGRTIGHVDAIFVQDGVRWRLVSLEPEPPLVVDDRAPVDPEIDRIISEDVERRYVELSERRYTIHPDSALIEMKDDLTPESFADFVGQVLCGITGAEVALLNSGAFNFEGLTAIHSRDRRRRFLTVRDLEMLMWAENAVVTMKLTGHQLKSVLQRSESRYPHTSQGGHLFHRGVSYRTPNLAGMRVNGRSLQEREMYKVVTTNFLASGGDGYTELSAGAAKRLIFLDERRLRPDEVGKPVVVREVMQAFLRWGTDRLTDTLNEWLTRRDRSHRSLWRVGLWNVRVNVKNIRVSDNKKVRGVTETKVQAQDVVNLTGGIEFQVERDSPMLNSKAAVRVSYGRVRTTGQAARETDDDLQGEIALLMKRLTTAWTAPVVVLKYDSEFTPTRATGTKNPRQRDVITTFGLAPPRLWGFEEVRFGLASIYDLSAHRFKGGFGLETTGRYQRRFRGKLGYRGDYRLLYVFPSREEKATDTELILQIRNGLTVPLVGDLSLIPGVDLYLFRAKIVGGLFQNAEVTLALSYSRAWKVIY